MDRATLEHRAWTVGLSALVGVVVGGSVAADPASFLLVAAVAFLIGLPIVSRVLDRSIGPDSDQPGRLTLFWGTIVLAMPLFWVMDAVAPGGSVTLALRGVGIAIVFLFATWLAYYGGYDRIREDVS
ncbi:hypothetical protein [Halostella sp. PRR32]|uniref:hypothetical protein n=1 Tax=Halostella sp. PRR32 TaxID=3098147 RepID=UPI002B1D872B|nr:hypothetical protein [Halostella sp. PRR32]